MKARDTGGLDDAEARRAKVASVAEALEVLEDAVIAQGVGIRMDMVRPVGSGLCVGRGL